MPYFSYFSLHDKFMARLVWLTRCPWTRRYSLGISDRLLLKIFCAAFTVVFPPFWSIYLSSCFITGVFPINHLDCCQSLRTTWTDSALIQSHLLLKPEFTVKTLQLKSRFLFTVLLLPGVYAPSCRLEGKRRGAEFCQRLDRRHTLPSPWTRLNTKLPQPSWRIWSMLIWEQFRLPFSVVTEVKTRQSASETPSTDPSMNHWQFCLTFWKQWPLWGWSVRTTSAREVSYLRVSVLVSDSQPSWDVTNKEELINRRVSDLWKGFWIEEMWKFQGSWAAPDVVMIWSLGLHAFLTDAPALWIIC